MNGAPHLGCARPFTIRWAITFRALEESAEDVARRLDILLNMNANTTTKTRRPRKSAALKALESERDRLYRAGSYAGLTDEQSASIDAALDRNAAAMAAL